MKKIHITLTQLQALIAVVEIGSFTGASEHLGLTQSAVSHAIATLEHELGVSLLERDARRNRTTRHATPRLTELGQRIVILTRDILSKAEQIQQAAAAAVGLETGKIRLASFPSISARFLPGLLRQFQQRYPGIDTLLFEGTDDEVKQWIMSRTVDLGVVTLPCNELDTMAIAQDDFLAVVSSSHPLAHCPHITFEQLAQEPFIMSNAGCKSMINHLFRQAHVTPRIQFEVLDSKTIFAMVQEGIGVTIVPELALPDDSDRLQVLHLTPRASRKLALARISSAPTTPAVAAFLTQAQDWAHAQQFL